MVANVSMIVSAAGKLKPEQFLRLRRELDAIEDRLWVRQCSRVSRKLERGGLTDAKIDRIVRRRRLESRA